MNNFAMDLFLKKFLHLKNEMKGISYVRFVHPDYMLVRKLPFTWKYLKYINIVQMYFR